MVKRISTTQNDIAIQRKRLPGIFFPNSAGRAKTEAGVTPKNSHTK